MSTRMRSITGWIVGAAVAAALAFGLMVATARPASALTCQNDGWDWVGQQPDLETCKNVCRAVHGDPGAKWNSISGQLLSVPVLTRFKSSARRLWRPGAACPSSYRVDPRERGVTIKSVSLLRVHCK